MRHAERRTADSPLQAYNYGKAGRMVSQATNADWLALTVEEPLEPDLPICDPHHHLWDCRPHASHRVIC